MDNNYSTQSESSPRPGNHWRLQTAINIARDEITNKDSDELRGFFHSADAELKSGNFRRFDTAHQAEGYRLVAFETLEQRGETVST